jgi:MFS family permease
MRRDLLLLAMTMILWGIGEGLFFFFQPIYMQQLGADPLKIGAILGGFGLMMTISHLPAGYLADRYGRKPLLVSAWVMGLTATWVMALANTLPAFVTGLMMYGLTMFVMSPLYSYVTAARGKLSVARAITLISASYNMGVVIGPTLGGWIGNQFGLRQTFFVAAWIFMASTLLMLFLRPQPVDKIASPGEDKGWFLNPRYLAYLGVIFLAVFAMYLPQPLSPNFLQYQRSLDLSTIGSLYSLSSIGVVIFSLVLGHFPARWGFMLGQLAVVFFTLILWKTAGLPWYYVGFFLLGGFKTTRNLGLAQVRQLIHQARMGIAYAQAETASSMAVILAPILAGILYSREPTWMYICSAVLIGISMLISARFSPAQRDDALEPSQPRTLTHDISSANPQLTGHHLSIHPVNLVDQSHSNPNSTQERGDS